MWRFMLLVLIISVGTALGHDLGNRMCKNLTWTGGESIKWPCATTRMLYKSTKQFVSKNMLATRVAIHGDNAFVAMPRFKIGIPFTLGKLSLKDKGCEASMAPFPSWSLQEEGNCAALQNVVDIFLDPRDILWVLDTGIVNTLDEPIRRCPSKVVAINVKSGKVVKRVDLTPLMTTCSRLQYLVADYTRDDHVFAYVSDAANRAILVFDVTAGQGYRVILPKDVTLGCTRRDVLVLALLRRPDGENALLLTYFSGKHLFSVKTRYLHTGSAHGRITDLGPKESRFVFLGTDNGSTIFFRKEGESDVYKWDLSTCTCKSNIERVYRGKCCELATHVVADYKRNRMRVLESNFPDYFQDMVGCGANHALSVF